jgi:hypothetical protein
MQVAVVGSADETRVYEAVLTDVQQAKHAAEEIGRELAGASCRIVVY